ncbi:hypothetical protein [Cellulophaga omnivescoria]|uniref:hypothetical protein n=1 Tax=Cellulophaga omnivescoria TaxID=1888890 RepID=UPI0009840BA8|nr:hypothetical protein [Cellulophaga omnivescoria]
MSKKLISRTKLFDKFSKQLHLLKENGLIDIELKYDETYICPLCLEQFQRVDLISDTNKNFLTEEDAPPEKLGGSRIALTCKDCNSKAGYQIDNHLINRIRENDDRKFYKGSKQYGNLEYNGERVTAEITSNGDGTLTVLHRTKKNNPNILDKFIYGIKNKTIGPILNLEPKKYKIDSERVNLALLKTNYIINFAKFGYIFLLDKHYDSIRTQIENMDEGYDGQIFLKDQFPKNKEGIYYVLNPGAKSTFSIFSLKTEYSETLIGAILPLPNKTPEEIHYSLTGNGYSIGENGKIGVSLDTSNYDGGADLFNDLNEINKIINWKNAQ